MFCTVWSCIKDKWCTIKIKHSFKNIPMKWYLKWSCLKCLPVKGYGEGNKGCSTGIICCLIHLQYHGPHLSGSRGEWFLFLESGKLQSIHSRKLEKLFFILTIHSTDLQKRLSNFWYKCPPQQSTKIIQILFFSFTIAGFPVTIYYKNVYFDGHPFFLYFSQNTLY